MIDGDTVRVRAFGARRSTYTVRLLGIDTPETRKPGTPIECGGKEATAALLALSFTEPKDSDGDGILDQEGGVGRRVTLTTDPTQDVFDRFRRLLAYVETLDGDQLNVAQIAAGWSATYVFERRFRQYGRFRAAESRARAARRGAGRVVAATSIGRRGSGFRAGCREGSPTGPPASLAASALVTSGLPSRPRVDGDFRELGRLRPRVGVFLRDLSGWCCALARLRKGLNDRDPAALPDLPGR